MTACKIKFKGKILDNVHGFIDYTEAEEKIMSLQLFKRLQSIKQLSLVNWVFPGSEHTRYTHSLGVMHIADQIAVQLELDDCERKIARFAGLLHDIGHYPLSHVCEFPYKKAFSANNALEISEFCSNVNDGIVSDIDRFKIDVEKEFMIESKGGHHEAVGVEIIRNNQDIINIIRDEFDGNDEPLNIICDMIVGKLGDRERYTITKNYQILVQLLHSELDADNIDYMLRDAVFSGTGFGSFEISQLIRCMCIGDYKDNKILCIDPKGIAAADQYLLNKFFSYSQVVYNKHTAILEWMAEKLVIFMKDNNIKFPGIKELINEWIKKEENYLKYLSFTDTFFWQSLNFIMDNPIGKFLPQYVLKFSELLLQHGELEYIQGSEIKINSCDCNEIVHRLKQADIYTNQEARKDCITILSQRAMSKHVPYEEFKEHLDRSNETEDGEALDENYKNEQIVNRLIDGICIKDGDNLHLLCDDERSLMRKLYNNHLVVMRSYKLED